ncbi:MAG: glycosyltransferase [Ruminococcaceae bacterium]|nr:glycosyltransferase [Oscillospiraceae bacterium]
MNQFPKVSVIVPVYNSEKYLEKCFDSILSQTLSEVELIVVNDGSPDDSQRIIDEYVSRYPDRIKAISQENRGQSAARNAGIKLATGQFIAFVDSDDYIETDAYEKSYTKAQAEDLDIVCFDLWVCEGEEKKSNHVDFYDPYPDDVKYVLRESSPCNKIIKRSLWEKSGLSFVENHIYEDFELVPRLALHTDRIGFISEPLYDYIIHEGSTMNQPRYTEKLASIYEVMETLKESFTGTKYEHEMEFLYIDHLLYYGVSRYLNYIEGDGDIKKIAGIMKKEFPKWRKNRYYKKKGLKYKVFCNLAAAKQIKLMKFLLHK